MSYSIAMHKIVRTGNSYTAEPVDHYWDEYEISDEWVRSVTISDMAIDPIDLFGISGRKCKVVVTRLVQFDLGSHPDYPDWTDRIFSVKLDGNLIFIGALQYAGFSIDDLNGTYVLNLSDATDVWIAISKTDQEIPYSPGNVWALSHITGQMIPRVLRRFTPLMAECSNAPNMPRVMVRDAYVKYPGFSGGDLAYLWAEIEYSPIYIGLTKRSIVWHDTQAGEINIVFLMLYARVISGRYTGKGYRLFINDTDPFNITRDAIYFEHSAASKPELTNILHQQGIIPTASTSNALSLTYGDTTVTAGEHYFQLSGYVDMSSMRFNGEATESEIIKALLTCNLCSIMTRYTWDNKSQTSIVQKIKPGISLAMGDHLITKFFTPSEITHYAVSGITQNKRSLQALSVVFDAENKMSLVTGIYNTLFSNVRNVATFSAHHTVSEVGSLQIGDIIHISDLSWNWIITAISDQDSNGLITFTAAGRI